jgi:hypothetical protein
MFQATDPQTIRVRLAIDPWHAQDLRHVARSAPWDLRIGSFA